MTDGAPVNVCPLRKKCHTALYYLHYLGSSIPRASLGRSMEPYVYLPVLKSAVIIALGVFSGPYAQCFNVSS